MEFLYKTRGDVLPNNKTRVFFCATKADFDLYFEETAEDILSVIDCAIYYMDYDKEDVYVNNGGELLDFIEQIQVVVAPVTRDLLYTDNFTKNVLIPAIRDKKQILPMMMEEGMTEDFQNLFGKVQYMDKYGKHERAQGTQIPYIDKLRTTLNRILIPDQLIDDVKAAFKAHIFLSYRKQDRKDAQKLMKMIHSDPRCEQIAIWYDEFLVPGEDYNQAIADAIEACDIFFFNVTESFLQEGNYVVRVEYPNARESGKKIIPVEMRKVDLDKLVEMFEQIDESLIPIEQHDKVCPVTYDALSAVLSDEEMEEAKLSFFIGLGYLNGIDVEVDVEKGISILERSANGACTEAMQQLANIYLNGIGGVEVDLEKAAAWQKRAVEIMTSQVLEFTDLTEQVCEAISLLVEIYIDKNDREGFNQLEKTMGQIGDALRKKVAVDADYGLAWKTFMKLRIESLAWSGDTALGAEKIFDELNEVSAYKDVLDAKLHMSMLCDIAASAQGLIRFANEARFIWMKEQSRLSEIESFDFGMRICELLNRQRFSPYSMYNYKEGEKPVNRAFVERELFWLPLVDQLLSLCKEQESNDSEWKNRLVYANYVAAYTFANIVCLNPGSIVDDALNEELQGYMDSFFDGIASVISSDISADEKKEWIERCLIMAGKMYNFELDFIAIEECISNWEARIAIAAKAAKQIWEEAKTRESEIYYLTTLIHVGDGEADRRGAHAVEFADDALSLAKRYYEKTHSIQAVQWLMRCEEIRYIVAKDAVALKHAYSLAQEMWTNAPGYVENAKVLRRVYSVLMHTVDYYVKVEHNAAETQKAINIAVQIAKTVASNKATEEKKVNFCLGELKGLGLFRSGVSDDEKDMMDVFEKLENQRAEVVDLWEAAKIDRLVLKGEIEKLYAAAKEYHKSPTQIEKALAIYQKIDAKKELAVYQEFDCFYQLKRYEEAMVLWERAKEAMETALEDMWDPLGVAKTYHDFYVKLLACCDTLGKKELLGELLPEATARCEELAQEVEKNKSRLGAFNYKIYKGMIDRTRKTLEDYKV